MLVRRSAPPNDIREPTFKRATRSEIAFTKTRVCDPVVVPSNRLNRQRRRTGLDVATARGQKESLHQVRSATALRRQRDRPNLRRPRGLVLRNQKRLPKPLM